MPGVFIVPNDANARVVIDNLVLIAGVGAPEDWRDRVVFLPLDD